MKKKNRIISIAIVLVALVFCLVVLNFSQTQTYSSSSEIIVAMNTIVSYKLYDDNNAQDEFLGEVEDIINELESQISWRISDSAVSELNENLELESETIAEILSLCLQVSEISFGAFDVSIGNVTTLWDIGGENERIPSEEEILSALDLSGYEHISIDDNVITLDCNVSIDLGAIGKGLACDWVKTYLQTTDIEGAIVSVGGSILAYGSYNDSDEPWQIAILNPRDEDSYIAVIKLDEGFVSTSGDYERYFEVDEVRYHHILDGNTGYPSDSDLISVTVVASTGLLSDALSTAIFACSSENAEEILEYYGASAVLIDSELNITIIGDIDVELLD